MEYASKWSDDSLVERCYDILLNFIVSDITNLSPIKVGQRLTFNEQPVRDNEEITLKTSCLNTLYEKFGFLPLKMSHVRFDPALYKDNVAKTRKKYLVLENV